MKHSSMKDSGLATSYDSILQEAFDLVKPDSHWKDPISATVEVDSDQAGTTAGLISHAVSHFTGTTARIDMVSLNGDRTLLVVLADGYRAGPCGDN